MAQRNRNEGDHDAVTPATARILTIGDELLSGDTIDTNGAYLGQRCREVGVEVLCAVSVRDRLDEIACALGDACRGADVCFVSGGLGPTSDDLTAEAVARASGRPLRRRPEIEADIEAKFRLFGRPMPEINRKQADLPEDATWLPNPIGSAPGFMVEIGRCRVFVMPGVPVELRKMMVEQVEPRLRAVWPLRPWPRRIYRLLGRGESSVASDVEPVVFRARQRSPEWAGLSVHYRASHPEVRVVLEAAPDPHGRHPDAEALQELDRELIPLMGPALYGLGEADLPDRVVRGLSQAGLRVATAESCTAGGVGVLLGRVPGASACWVGTVVAYANPIKTRLLGVDSDLIERHGAVSEEVARAMAEGARAAMGADLAVATTGIAGPGGAVPEKPVGTVHLAVSDQDGTEHCRLSLRGNRATVQRGASLWALKLLWDRLVQRGHARIEVFDSIQI